MTEKERKKERKEKEEGYRFLTLRLKLNFISTCYLSQHHQKKKKKASRFYPTRNPIFLHFFFTHSASFFFSIFFGIWIMYVCIPYLVESKGLVSGSEKEFIRKYRGMMLNGIKRSMALFFVYLSSSFFIPSFLFIHLLLPSHISHLTA